MLIEIKTVSRNDLQHAVSDLNLVIATVAFKVYGFPALVSHR